MSLWLVLLWDCVKTLLSGELAAWLRERRAKTQAKEDANATPLTKQEELADIGNLPDR